SGRWPRRRPISPVPRRPPRPAGHGEGSFRAPGLIVAGGGRALAQGGQRALRATRHRRARHVRQMILLPRLTRQRTLGRSLVIGVAQPALPLRRHLGRLGIAVIDDPAALAAVIADGVAGFVVAVAELVRADLLAAFANGEQGADRGAVPPGEDFAQHVVELTRIHRPGEVRRRGPIIETATPYVQRRAHWKRLNILWATPTTAATSIERRHDRPMGCLQDTLHLQRGRRLMRFKPLFAPLAAAVPVALRE